MPQNDVRFIPRGPGVAARGADAHQGYSTGMDAKHRSRLALSKRKVSFMMKCPGWSSSSMKEVESGFQNL